MHINDDDDTEIQMAEIDGPDDESSELSQSTNESNRQSLRK